MNTDAPTSASTPLRSLIRRLPPTTRGHTVAVIGEFVGTISFLFFAFAGTQYVFPTLCRIQSIALLVAFRLPFMRQLWEVSCHTSALVHLSEVVSWFSDFR